MSNEDLMITMPLKMFEQLMLDLQRDKNNLIWRRDQYEAAVRKINPNYQALLDAAKAERDKVNQVNTAAAEQFFQDNDGKLVWYRSQTHRTRVRVKGIRGALIVCELLDKKPEAHKNPKAPREKIWMGWAEDPALSLEWLEPMV